MRTLSSAIVLFSCVLIMSLPASGQAAPPAATNSQASGDNCAPTEGRSKDDQPQAPSWLLIYPASKASYVGGTVKKMLRKEGLGHRLERSFLFEPRQFRRDGQIALSSGCLLFAFNSNGVEPSSEVDANYRIFKCSNKAKLSDGDNTCQLVTSEKPLTSYVIAIPYPKVNVLSRAKYPDSDLASFSTMYATFAGGVIGGLLSSNKPWSIVGGVAGGLAIYYAVAINTRKRDNYIAVFVEPPAPQISLSRKSNGVTVTTSSLHSFHAGQQIQVSDFANSELTNISEISRDAKGIVKVTTKPPHGLPVGAQVQIADVTDDPSLNGQFQVASAPSSTTFTYEQKDLLKKAVGPFVTGKVQDVWNGTFPIESVTNTTLTYVQVGPDNQTASTGTVAAPPQNTTLTVTGNLAGNQPRAPNSRSATLAGTATLSQPPPDDLFKKGDLVMFRIPNHHDYYNISMILSGGTGLTFVSETAEKTGK